MQYWINHNGVQSGPVDIDALKQMGLTSAAYVWHEGLTDWVKITQLPELQGVYVMEGPAAGQPTAATEQSVSAEAEASAAPVHEQNVAVEGQPYQNQQPYQPQRPYQPYQPQYAEEQPAEPCPPTNLVWAIIATVLCCIPTGIVAIVYALKVTNKYREGDIEGAKRASEVGAWWCIASIILGIICQPFVMWLQSLALAAG